MVIRLSFFSILFVAVAILFSGNTRADFDAAGYYKMRCSSCHGANGEGTESKVPQLGPALKGNPLVMNAPAEAIEQVIRKGRSGANRIYDKSFPNMPAFGAEAVPDVAALVQYLKTGLQNQP